jgi:hypothetical protein
MAWTDEARRASAEARQQAASEAAKDKEHSIKINAEADRKIAAQGGVQAVRDKAFATHGGIVPHGPGTNTTADLHAKTLQPKGAAVHPEVNTKEWKASEEARKATENASWGGHHPDVKRDLLLDAAGKHERAANVAQANVHRKASQELINKAKKL